MSITHAADTRIERELAMVGESAEDKLDRVLTELAAIRGDIQDSKTFIEKIMGEVKPVLDTLTKNSMFKMMFGSK